MWLAVFLTVANVPPAWRKTQGGDGVTWIGYRVLVKELALGISEARAAWAVNWLQRGARDGVMNIDELRGAVGRLAFVAGALEYDRSF